MEIKKVGVLGCGLMGSGIAQVCAMSGFGVTVLEVAQKFLDKGFAGIEKSLAKFAERPPEKGGITAQHTHTISGSVAAAAGEVVVGWEIFCLANLARADEGRFLPRWAWAIACLIQIPLGGVAYLAIGRVWTRRAAASSGRLRQRRC